jgi:hypothetical protein
LASILFWNLLRNCRYILGDSCLRTAWIFTQILCQLVDTHLQPLLGADEASGKSWQQLISTIHDGSDGLTLCESLTRLWLQLPFVYHQRFLCNFIDTDLTIWSVSTCRLSMERCALSGMMQQGAVASWVLLSQVLLMLQK